MQEVSRAIGTDSRIGLRFLESGPGFGGSCFKKDILNLVYLSRYFGLPEVADFWESVVHLNYWHQHRISQLIVKKLFGTVSSKKITILGFAFKANTNDTRESAAIKICKDLIEEGAELIIHDPKVNPKQIEKDLEMAQISKNDISITTKDSDGGWQFNSNIYDSFLGSDACVILTEWAEYSNIDWIKASKNNEEAFLGFDARSIANVNKVKDANLSLWRLGDGS